MKDKKLLEAARKHVMQVDLDLQRYLDARPGWTITDFQLDRRFRFLERQLETAERRLEQLQRQR